MASSSSEGSAQLPLPASSGGSAGSSGGCPTPPPPEPMLVSKVLTYSDVSTEVARTGRIVLPRIQVQQCLPELLRLCQAEAALPAVRSGGPVKLSVDLVVEDEAGRTWVLLMKTWQNVVSGEHRPTFVLENTADFVRANQLVQGNTLAFCPYHGRMLLRTSLRADQLLPRNLKRAATGPAGGAAANRRATAAAAASARSPPAASTPEPPAYAGAATHARRHVKVAVAAVSEPPACAAAARPFWQPSPVHAAEAAQALLDILHSADCSLDSSASEGSEHAGPLSAAGSPAPSTAAAAAAADAPHAAAGAPLSAQPSVPPAAGYPAQPATCGPHPIYRPRPVHSAAAIGSTQRQLPLPPPQQQQQCVSYSADTVAAEAAAALAATGPGPEQVLPPVAPLSPASTPLQLQQCAGAAAGGVLPPKALAQAHSWLASILAQQEQERRWVEQYNRLLLLQALQQEAAQAAAAAQQQQQRYFASLHA